MVFFVDSFESKEPSPGIPQFTHGKVGPQNPGSTWSDMGPLEMA